MHSIYDYVPIDRRYALMHGVSIPDRATGAVLFADISGFTPTTEAIVRIYGPRRGAEELLLILNPIYEALMIETDRYGGSVINMSGDALTVWFASDQENDLTKAGLRAVACAQAIQAAMQAFRRIVLSNGTVLALAIKTTVAIGPVRRFMTGDPAVQVLEVLAGSTMKRLAAAAAITTAGDVVLDSNASTMLADHVAVLEWRIADDQQRCAVISALHQHVQPQPWADLPLATLRDEQLRAWLVPSIYTLLRNQQSEFSTELRYTVSLFLRFSDLDYDDRDDAGELLDRFVRWVQRVLARYQGWLIQVTIGDKGSYLYASFGAPYAHGDDAVRAVGAALDLHSLPPALAYIGAIQIGLSGGQSRTGSVGGSFRSYSVMGDATNLAARLMEAAIPGQILMSANLVPMVSRRYHVQQLAPIKLKGKREAVPVVLISGQHDSAMRLSEPQYGLPLVGRQAELKLIDQRIALVLSGNGQTIAISGEAGIGKSRLIAEIIRRTDYAHMLALGGSAQSTRAQAAYDIWRPIWQGLFRLDPLALPESQAAALEQALIDLDMRFLPRLPLLGLLLDLPLPESDLTHGMDPKQRKEALEELLVDCLIAYVQPGKGATTAAPLVLVLEDAHWMDALSVDLVRRIGQAIPQLPILLIVSHRPLDPGHALQPLLPLLPNSVALEINELPAVEAEQLLRQKAASVFGGEQELSASLIEAILARAEGNPFYIEELLNYLHDRKQALDAPASLELPTSLTSLLLSRIDQLSTEQQIALKVASVIGRIFQVALLWGAYPSLGLPDQVRRDLEQLSELEITPLDTPEPDLSYLFKHATIREVAYESLPYALRAQLHEQLAAWLEARMPTEAPLDLLAYHYGASANIAKQREYFQKAGDAALTRYANAAARQYYERLLELQSPEEQVLTLLALGRIHSMTSSWVDAERVYRTMLEQLGGVEQVTLQRAQALVGIGATMWGRGRFEEGHDWMSRGLQMFEALNDQANISATLLQMARTNWLQGQHDQTLAFVQRSLALEGSVGDKARMAMAYNILGNLALSRLQPDNAIIYLSESLRLQRELGNAHAIAVLTINLGVLAFVQKRYADAHTYVLESQNLCRQLGSRWEYGVARVIQSYVLAAEQQFQAAVQINREVVLLYGELEASTLLDLPFLGLAQAVLRGQLSPEAEQYAIRLIAAGQQLHDAHNSKRMVFYQAIADDIMALAQQNITQAVVDTAWAEGYAMDPKSASEYALRVLAL